MKAKRKLAVAPRYDEDGVPHCSREKCGSYMRRMRKDGQPSKSRAWFCAHNDTRPGWLCAPAIREMATKLRSAFGLIKHTDECLADAASGAKAARP